MKDARAAVDEALGREMQSKTVSHELRLANNVFRRQQWKALNFLKAKAAYKCYSFMYSVVSHAHSLDHVLTSERVPARASAGCAAEHGNQYYCVRLVG